MADQKTPTTAEIVIMGAGAAALVGSFLHFYIGTSSWNGAIFPVFTMVGIFGAIMAAQIALTKYANVSLPDKVAGLTWPQIHFVLGFYCAVLMISQLINGTSGTKIGFWVMLAGGIGLLVGAVLLGKERSGTPTI
jgi:hypothetical protein